MFQSAGDRPTQQCCKVNICSDFLEITNLFNRLKCLDNCVSGDIIETFAIFDWPFFHTSTKFKYRREGNMDAGSKIEGK